MQLAQSLGCFLLGLGTGQRRHHSSSSGGADAPRTLPAPLQGELLSDLCNAVNPAFDSGIFFTARRVFLLGLVAVGGPEAPVISTSDSLLTEESEENSSLSFAGFRSSASSAVSLLGPPSGRRVGDQNSRTLAYRNFELCHNPTGAVGKTEQKQRKQLGN